MPIQNLNPDVLMMGLAEDWFHGAGRGGLRALRYPRKPKHLIPRDLAIVRKHPEKAPAEILRDLIQSTPCEEGKWFATAKEAGLLDLAIDLANRSPTDPQTLTRAARDFMDRNPVFALEAGRAALAWAGLRLQITRADVWTTYSHTMQVAERLGRRDEIPRASASWPLMEDLLPTSSGENSGLADSRKLRRSPKWEQAEKPHPVLSAPRNVCHLYGVKLDALPGAIRAAAQTLIVRH